MRRSYAFLSQRSPSSNGQPQTRPGNNASPQRKTARPDTDAILRSAICCYAAPDDKLHPADISVAPSEAADLRAAASGRARPEQDRLPTPKTGANRGSISTLGLERAPRASAERSSPRRRPCQLPSVPRKARRAGLSNQKPKHHPKNAQMCCLFLLDIDTHYGDHAERGCDKPTVNVLLMCKILVTNCLIQPSLVE